MASGSTRAGTLYSLCNEKKVKDSAYERAKVAYFQSQPELYVGQDMYSYVNGLCYIISKVGCGRFECMGAYSTDQKIPLRMHIDMFHHNFSATPIPDSNILHEPLKRLRKANNDRYM